MPRPKGTKKVSIGIRIFIGWKRFIAMRAARMKRTKISIIEEALERQHGAVDEHGRKVK